MILLKEVKNEENSLEKINFVLLHWYYLPDKATNVSNTLFWEIGY